MVVPKNSPKINLITLLLLASMSSIMSSPCASAHTNVTAEQARDLIDSTNNLTIVDVREPPEYCDARGHIPGAMNYPWNSGVLRARYEELPINYPILVVCRSGGRSNNAANFLDSKGFSTVYDMLGGMSSWAWETAPCKYSGGSGTAADPYQIATAEDLMLLGESPEDYDKHFILTADIDLDPNLPGRKVFDNAVIAPNTGDDLWSFHFWGIPFNGVFDGNGHKISHLTIAGKDYLGLFGQSGSAANISNLGLEAVDVNGTGYYIGGLLGSNGGRSVSSGTVTQCYCTGNVSGDSHVGGLVGYNENGGITTSYSTGTVTGRWWIGGIVGYNEWGSIFTSYSTGTVTGERYVGGLVGQNWGGSISSSFSTCMVIGNEDVGGFVGDNPGGSIAMSYSKGIVSGDERVGGLIGRNYGSITSSFWDMENSGQTTSAGGRGLTTAEMQNIDTFLSEGWDFVDETANGTCDFWQILSGDYPQLFYHIGNSPVMPEGLGTAEEPYLIRDTRDLGTVWFDPMAHYRLESPVDLSGITWSTSVVLWFSGTFDGNGNVISNLHILGGGNLGLFGQIATEAKIYKLGLEAVDAKGTGHYVGSLAGQNNGNISTSYSKGTVSGANCIGGLAGKNYGSITASYSTCTVTGNENVGGLVGENWSGSITRSYSKGMVSGAGYCIGGLVGFNGYHSNITSSFWDMEASGLTGSDGGTGLTTAEMMDPYMLGLNGFANDPNWILAPYLDYPRLAWEGAPGQIISKPEINWLQGNGTPENPYQIVTADQLILLGKASILWGKRFVLGANIDLDPNLRDGQSFGQAIIPEFTGVCDGNDHIIYNLVITGGPHLGLFGRLEIGAMVKNLGVVDANITGSGNSVGCLVGLNCGDVSNCYSTGTVSVGYDYVGGLVGENWGSILMSYSEDSVIGDDYVGGLVGYNCEGSIASSYSTGTVCVGYEYVGGLVGGNYEGSISSSHSTGMVTGEKRVGGLVGYNFEGSIAMSYSTGSVGGNQYIGGLLGDNNGSIATSYSTSTITGKRYVGGLAGQSGGGSIVTSYSTGTVSGEYDCIGGLVGLNYGPVTNCYSTGTVSGYGSVGGFVGISWGGRGRANITSSFWDIETSGQTASEGGVGKTTAEMQTTDTFLEAGWDFAGETENGTEDIWWIDEGQDYPHLWWELIEVETD